MRFSSFLQKKNDGNLAPSPFRAPRGLKLRIRMALATIKKTDEDDMMLYDVHANDENDMI